LVATGATVCGIGGGIDTKAIAAGLSAGAFSSTCSAVFVTGADVHTGIRADHLSNGTLLATDLAITCGDTALGCRARLTGCTAVIDIEIIDAFAITFVLTSGADACAAFASLFGTTDIATCSAVGVVNSGVRTCSAATFLTSDTVGVDFAARCAISQRGADFSLGAIVVVFATFFAGSLVAILSGWALIVRDQTFDADLELLIAMRCFGISAIAILQTDDAQFGSCIADKTLGTSGIIGGAFSTTDIIFAYFTGLTIAGEVAHHTFFIGRTLGIFFSACAMSIFNTFDALFDAFVTGRSLSFGAIRVFVTFHTSARAEITDGFIGAIGMFLATALDTFI
jgi:hypothetical protein